MHIPKSFEPDETVAGDSVQHFKQGIEKLTELNSQMAQRFKSFTAVQQTRCGLAAYDAGTFAIHNKYTIDKETTNGDFSADILARAKYIREKILNDASL